MKKVLYLIAILLGSVLLIGNVQAKTTMTGLKETVQEEINYFDNKDNFTSNGVFNEQVFNAYQEYVLKLKNADLSNYEESDDKVNVYVFRGSSCWHCLDDIAFLADNVKEYGKYFNIKTYEVWGNNDNNKLMSTVAKKLGETVSGVPYTVIGKKTYSGFSETSGNEMLSIVKEQFDNKDRYDIKNEIDLENGTIKSNDNEDKSGSTAIVIISIFAILIIGIALIYFISKK